MILSIHNCAGFSTTCRWNLVTATAPDGVVLVFYSHHPYSTVDQNHLEVMSRSKYLFKLCKPIRGQLKSWKLNQWKPLIKKASAVIKALKLIHNDQERRKEKQSMARIVELGLVGKLQGDYLTLFNLLKEGGYPDWTLESYRQMTNDWSVYGFLQTLQCFVHCCHMYYREKV